MLGVQVLVVVSGARWHDRDASAGGRRQAEVDREPEQRRALVPRDLDLERATRFLRSTGIPFISTCVEVYQRR